MNEKEKLNWDVSLITFTCKVVCQLDGDMMPIEEVQEIVTVAMESLGKEGLLSDSVKLEKIQPLIIK